MPVQKMERFLKERTLFFPFPVQFRGKKKFSFETADKIGGRGKGTLTGDLFNGQ